MKTIAVSKADSKLNSVVGSAQKEHVVLTRGGRPSAVLIGIESYDAEDCELAASGDFWRLIESRRSGRTIPLAELKRRLVGDDPVDPGSTRRRKSTGRNQVSLTKRKR